MNLSNAEPTKCINQLALEVGLSPIPREMLLARTFNILESLLQTVEKGNDREVFDKYYRYWLHDDQIVKIRSEDGVLQNGRIVSLDGDGFLLVNVDGKVMSVHPDGNSFDMLQGLIIPKK